MLHGVLQHQPGPAGWTPCQGGLAVVDNTTPIKFSQLPHKINWVRTHPWVFQLLTTHSNAHSTVTILLPCCCCRSGVITATVTAYANPFF
jgi:hypothetical protein